ncbi:hypothetical protein V6N11_024467 [Hibiscus sabdariffa]|uniref:Uncharacterized protein n=1 Tax=Hibiscus sabdariffa TaxID=183260 RepID=A0ABR2QM91_9ROSI
MPNDGTNLLEVPGNRLPETGSRQIKSLHIRAQPSRVTVYKQAEQLFGLRHKPITLRDALPKSDPNRDNLPRSDPLSLAETSPLSSSQSRISKHHYRRSRSIDNQS